LPPVLVASFGSARPASQSASSDRWIRAKPGPPPPSSTRVRRYDWNSVRWEEGMSGLQSDDGDRRMEYRRTGHTGLKLPQLSLGLWQNFGGDHPSEVQRAIIRRAFDLGITHFDLANNYGPPYGSAEQNFGRILASDLAGHRDELVISSKAGYDMWPGPYGIGGSRKYLLASLDQRLRRIGLEYVDIFYSHRFHPETPLEETMGALDTAVRQGKA